MVQIASHGASDRIGLRVGGHSDPGGLIPAECPVAAVTVQGRPAGGPQARALRAASESDGHRHRLKQAASVAAAAPPEPGPADRGRGWTVTASHGGPPGPAC